MPLRVISLGWGMQSWTMAAMSALGELEPVDFAIYADTTWERQHTYQFAAQWAPWLEEHGVRVVTVSDPQPMNDLASLKTDIPAYTSGTNGDGRLKRQCTSDWKIYPMRAYITTELRRRGLARRAGSVEQWIGISRDEWTRARDSDVKYIVNRFPLLELSMTRTDCVAWLERHELAVPGK